ncbi:hypothetical protein SELMODRAFT_415599 [Selaginella moellendorffii]|uniref:Uncharacterized protein n=1 Tax=Selaginella moellendorffii TaxID=88036 RepID=D8RWM8_SELML|nr:uncharacterized protein LOC9630611 [Selaginella moellendorffii]EFJ23115.1 hypothetical protein SELMODRAFT_415599 [Selaginella moellendorffii]|eukprot:XP_002975486.1 uncharacterized protein LOC9630611 [Selaginella moellendorffii]
MADSMAKLSSNLAMFRPGVALPPSQSCRNRRLVVRAAAGTIAGGGAGGYRTIRRRVAKVLSIGDKSAKFRDKASGDSPNIKLLSRIEQLRLLTKAEKAGLLSTAENLGFTLSSIEKLGLLSKAEELGVLSAATDPSTPGALLTTALALLLLGPAFVYFVPENSVPLVVLQAVVAAVSVLGGSAAFAASNFVATIQAAK